MSIPQIMGQTLAAAAGREAICMAVTTGSTTVMVTASGVVVPAIVAVGTIALAGTVAYACWSYLSGE